MSRETLKQARKAKGMTQQAMADYLGISERYYRAIEAGSKPGNFVLWDMLEDLLNVHQRKLREILENHPAQVNNRQILPKYQQWPQAL